MDIMAVERRRALNRERVRRHRAIHALSKKALSLPRLNRGPETHMEVMNLERRRALNRERVRRHRAAIARLKKTPALPQPDRGNCSSVAVPQTDANVHPLFELSSEELRSEDSDCGNADQPKAATVAANNAEMKEEQDKQQTDTGFNFEEFVSKLKVSPAPSVSSNASWKSYDLPISPSESLKTEDIQNFAEESTGVPNLGTGEMNVQNVPISTDPRVLQMIFEAIAKLSSEQSQLTAAVNRMNGTLECLASQMLHKKREPFEKKYDLRIPFENCEDFVQFDENLGSDDALRTAMVHSFIQKYDPKKTLTKNLTMMMRKFVTREVALHYTAQKAVGGKALFKNTTLSACLLETLDSLAEDKTIGRVSDNEYLGSLGSVLSNAKDWGIKRHERPIKRRANP